MSEQTRTAVLDRFEQTAAGDEVAVLLLETEGTITDEHIVPRSDLPQAGQHEDAVFTVGIVDGDPDTVTYEPADTEARRERAGDRFDRLSTRLSNNDETESDSD